MPRSTKLWRKDAPQKRQQGEVVLSVKVNIL
jgi:hypothetical protein